MEAVDVEESVAVAESGDPEVEVVASPSEELVDPREGVPFARPTAGETPRAHGNTIW